MTFTVRACTLAPVMPAAQPTTALETELELVAMKGLPPSAVTLGRVAQIERNLLLNAIEDMPAVQLRILELLRAGRLSHLRPN